jgi:glycosyltransferase involved in cell wall biosynthesis
VGKLLPVKGIVHGCYRGNRAGSAIVTAAYAWHRLTHTWDCVDLFIAVSELQREILVRGGLPLEKVAVKPNFVDADGWEAGRKTEEVALFVGRLSPEKGIGTLLTAWNAGKIPLRLKIIGDGPMAEEVRACSAANSAIEYLGPQPSRAVYREMARAKFLVFPSEWFEGLSRTVVEAFSLGTPILAADLGAVSELVEDGVTGYRFPAGDAGALIAGATRFPRGEDYERMRANCRNLFLSKFAPAINYTQLMKIYARAISGRGKRQQAC